MSVVYDSLSDGIDSSDTVRVESAEPTLLSQNEDTSSPSRSSGAVNNRSRGPLLSVRLSSFSDSCDLSIIDPTVIRFSLPVPVLRRLRDDLGGGMLVMAKRAATEGGIASGVCTSRGRWEEECGRRSAWCRCCR